MSIRYPIAGFESEVVGLQHHHHARTGERAGGRTCGRTRNRSICLRASRAGSKLSQGNGIRQSEPDSAQSECPEMPVFAFGRW